MSLLIPLSHDLPVERAAQLILQYLYEQLQEHEKGILEDENTECLHDFRVAIRRTRAALKQFQDVIPHEQGHHFRKQFAWLGRITTPVRDLDVYVEQFAHYEERMPHCFQSGYAILREDLHRLRKQGRHKLQQRCNERRYQHILQDWPQFVMVQWNIEQKRHSPTIIDYSPARTAAYGARVFEQGTAITDDSPPALLHDLRKSCKKLRYSIEFVQTLYPPDCIAEILKPLKQLQDVLGNYQDTQVQIEFLHDFAKNITPRKPSGKQELLTLGALIYLLQQRQQKARQEFHQLFYGLRPQAFHLPEI